MWKKDFNLKKKKQKDSKMASIQVIELRPEQK